jgi:hypothetical protein
MHDCDCDYEAAADEWEKEHSTKNKTTQDNNNTVELVHGPNGETVDLNEDEYIGSTEDDESVTHKEEEAAADEWEKEHSTKNKTEDNDNNDVEFAYYGPDGELDEVVDISEYLGHEGTEEEQDATADAWEKEHHNIKKEKPVDTHDGDVEVTVEHEHNYIMEQEEESVLEETAADEWEKEHQKDTDNNNDKDKDVKFAYGPNGELDKVMDVSEYYVDGDEAEEEAETVVSDVKGLYQETETQSTTISRVLKRRLMSMSMWTVMLSLTTSIMTKQKKKYR